MQTSNYPPVSGKKPKKGDKLIQGLYGEIDQNFLRMEQSLAAKLVNVVKNYKNSNANNLQIISIILLPKMENLKLKLLMA